MKNWKKRFTLFFVFLMFFSLNTMTGLAGDHSDIVPPLTGFEKRNGADWTTHEEELEFLEEVANLSDRVVYSEIGQTKEGRPIHLVRIGYPEPPSDEEIARGNNILIIGSQHGNEPAPREMTLQFLRNLAFSDDPEILEMLSEVTVLVIPTANPDGRVANTRANANGFDINRQHLNLGTEEVDAIGSVLNQFKPDITVDAHERPRATGDPDIEALWPRNLNVDEELRLLNKEMVEDYLFPALENAGFSTGLYGTPGGAGGGDERILRNVLGLRHGLGLLTETAGLQEPTYRVEAQLVAIETVLAFYWERFDDVKKVVAEAPERRAADGLDRSVPFYLDGADNWDPTKVLEKKPSGYLLTSAQAEQVSKHIELFSLQTEEVAGNGVFVPMSQPMMTVIPFLFDERATYNEVDALALYDSTNVGTATNMKALVEHFEEEGAFVRESDARQLKMHLTAVDLFEQQQAGEKILKHLYNLLILLDYQYNNEFISEKAYHDLAAYTHYLIDKWVDDFNADNAMQHISYLSEDIGPRVAGTEFEKEAAEYIKNELERLGYDVSVQEFGIRNDQQTSQNVIAVKKPEGVQNPEIIYVTAHYDSVPGSPGANDNASGTATMLEIARIMKDFPTNKEIRFIAFGSEEIGLVGARSYASQLTQDEIDRSLGAFNLDMVGTAWEPATQLYVNVVDGQPNLVWQYAKVAADKLNNDRLFLYQRGASDHVAFYEVGIDAANFIWREPGTANLEPYYHTPEDKIEHISPEKIQMVGELIYTAVTDLARELTNEGESLLEAS